MKTNKTNVILKVLIMIMMMGLGREKPFESSPTHQWPRIIQNQRCSMAVEAHALFIVDRNHAFTRSKATRNDACARSNVHKVMYKAVVDTSMDIIEGCG